MSEENLTTVPRYRKAIKYIFIFIFSALAVWIWGSIFGLWKKVFSDIQYEHIFQSSLYLYSSLIQADAAILGFGAVFVIYKLQLLETRRQGIIQSYQSLHPSGMELLDYLLVGGDDVGLIAEKMHDLRTSHASDYKNMMYIICIPITQTKISVKAKLPVLIIALQAVISSLMLWLTQFIYYTNWIHHFIVILNLLWFALGIILASKLAIFLLTGEESLSLEDCRPDILKMLNEIEDERKKRLLLLHDKLTNTQSVKDQNE
jgi:hypothetical protein